MKTIINVEKKVATFEIEIEKANTEKSVRIATSHGHQPTGVTVYGKELKANINAIIPLNGKSPYTPNENKCVVVKNNKMIITLPILPENTPSHSGKSFNVVDTAGYITSNAKMDGKNVKISVNAYIPKN